MPQTLTLASAQSRTLPTTTATLHALSETTRKAAAQNVDLILFPEAYLGGYPRTCSFGASVGSRDPLGREQFLQYFHAAVDLGDTPAGAGDAWVNRELPVGRESKRRGDGTREELERVARETGVFIVTGLVERAGGTLYCAVVYVCPREGVLGKRRKVMPTGSERLIWGQGSPASLRAVATTIRGVRVTLAAAICWENYMPLLRHSLYSQNVNLYLAPTADARDTWVPLMRTVGCESRAFVLSAISCVKRRNLPGWVKGGKGEEAAGGGSSHHPEVRSLNGRRKSTVTVTDEGNEICLPVVEENSTNGAPNGGPKLQHSSSQAIEDDDTAHPSSSQKAVPKSSLVQTTYSEEDGEEFVCRGGSCIISPFGDVIAGPLWEVENGGLLIAKVDFEDCERGRLDLDVAGSYSRNDSFRLEVEGLDLSPPPH